MAETPKVIEVGIVLRGGSALGGYECGGVTALLELMDAAEAAGRAVALKSVVGVSIGAINAACMVGAADRADARRRIAALWDDLTLTTPDLWPHAMRRDLSLFGLPGFYWPRSDYLNVAKWTSYYDTSPLGATLERHVDFAALNASDTAFVVAAVDVEDGTLKHFSNHNLDDEKATVIDARHIMASGALPPQFPWVNIDGRVYWGGGLVDNAPLGDAIDAFSHGGDVKRLLVVIDLYPLRARRPRTIADVEDRDHELSFGNRVRQDGETARCINDFVDTIEKLVALMPEGAIQGDLADAVGRARAFKTIDVVDIDMQSRIVEGKPRPEDPSDDEFGLRDFSSETVRRRRDVGLPAGARAPCAAFPERGMSGERRGLSKNHNGQTVVCPSQALGSICGAQTEARDSRTQLLRARTGKRGPRGCEQRSRSMPAPVMAVIRVQREPKMDDPRSSLSPPTREARAM